MSKVQPALMKSATFRRRMRGVKARSDWEAVMAQRKREIAAFNALPLGQRALDLGQDQLDPLAGVGQVGVGQRAERHSPHLVHELQRVGGVSRGEGGYAHQQPAERVVLARRLQKTVVSGRHALIKAAHDALKLGHALFKGLHRLLSVRLRCGEEAESPAGANPPPATKRSADR